MFFRFCFALLGLAMLWGSSSVWGSCGIGSCSLDPSDHASPKKWRVGIDYEEINQNHPFIGDQGSSVGAVHLHHDEVQTINKLWAFRVDGPILTDLEFSAQLPLIERKHTHIHHHHGDVIVQKWDYKEWGDTSVGLNYFVALDPNTRHQLKFSAALKLPTGVTTVKNSDGDTAEASLQPGSGSYDTTWGLSYHFSPKESMRFFSSVFYTACGNGTDGWRFGNKWLLSLGSQLQFTDAIWTEFQLNSIFQEKSDAGRTREPITTTGGSYVFFTPSLHCSIQSVDTYLLFQIPLYRHVNSIQLTADIQFKTGVSLSL